jgi:hypothetical protein
MGTSELHPHFVVMPPTKIIQCILVIYSTLRNERTLAYIHNLSKAFLVAKGGK